jgi:hypothetical protein
MQLIVRVLVGQGEHVLGPPLLPRASMTAVTVRANSRRLRHRQDAELERAGHGPFEIMGLICLGGGRLH